MKDKTASITVSQNSPFINNVKLYFIIVKLIRTLAHYI